MKTLNTLLLGLAVALSACSKKTSGNNNVYDPYNQGYQQPQYAPPNNNWNSYYPGQVPSGNCGQVSTLPSQCNGTYNGYSYCGNQWYYGWDNAYWIFPAFNTCSGGNNNNDDGWDDDDHHDGGSSSYNSGWKKLWNQASNNNSESIVITAPKDTTYYVSFKGKYTGKSQKHEELSVNFQGGNIHDIEDLDQNHSGSGDVTKSCKVNVNFKLHGGKSYRIYLKGHKDSVNDTYLRVTNFWPSDISKLCD